MRSLALCYARSRSLKTWTRKGRVGTFVYNPQFFCPFLNAQLVIEAKGWDAANTDLLARVTDSVKATRKKRPQM